MSLPLLIAHASSSSVLIPLVIALLSRKHITRDLFPLIILLIIALISDLISLVFFKLGMNSYLIVNLFLLFQFFLCFLLLLGKARATTTGNRAIAIGYTLLFFINLFFVQGMWKFNTYSNSLACLILMVLALRYLYSLLRDLPELFIHQLPYFWIAAAVLTYYAGNLLLFLTNNYLTLGIEGSHQIMWILHNLLNISKNMLFAIALWMNYRNKR